MPRMRRWVWLQVIIGWLPVWVLYAALMLGVHGTEHLSWVIVISLRSIAVAAVLGLLVLRLIDRFPWPRPFRFRFILVHLIAALIYSAAWATITSAMEGLLRPESAAIYRMLAGRSLAMGVWLYATIAGVAYASRAMERAARAEAAAASAQLAALRAQLHPHFLFNALHTVVHLIPRDPGRAARAAEQLASLLRTTIEEDRDLVSLGEEWAFVDRYLDLERIRFGERLRVTAVIGDEAAEGPIPAFALQTLVENAVRHGAAPRIEPTDIVVTGVVAGDALTLTVQDGGPGAAAEPLARETGTGLRRLRDQLEVLYGAEARLDAGAGPNGGFVATLVVPLGQSRDARDQAE